MTRLITRLYPRTWRERYGEELSDLIDETGLTPRVAIDVARGAAREWKSDAKLALAGGGTMVVIPAWRDPQRWAAIALIVLGPAAAFVVLSILTYQLGATWLLFVMDPVTRLMHSVRVLDPVLVVLPGFAFLIAVAPLFRLEVRNRESGREAFVGVRLKAANLAVALLALLIAALIGGYLIAADSAFQIGG